MFFRAQQRREWLNPKISQHVSSVHQTLSVYMLLFGLSSWLGTYIDMDYSKLEIVGAFSLFISIFSLYLVSMENLLSLSYMVPISTGLLFSPSIYISYQIDPMIVLVTTISTSVIFASVSSVAYRIQLVDMMYIYSFLASCLNITIIVGLMNLFIQSETLYFSNILFSLFIFIFYVVYDTKLMIDRAYQKELNNYEVVMDALHLFLDFANIFIRILSLLVRLSSRSRK
jgi:FtsH-binding integral membrane protein